MSDRSLIALAKGIFIAIVVLFLGGAIITLILAPRLETATWGLPGLLPNILLMVTFFSFPCVGVAIACRRPRNAVGWVLLGIGFVWAVTIGTDVYLAYGLKIRPGSLPRPDLVLALLSSWMWVPGVGLTGTYLLLLFPDGHLSTPKWRKVAWGTAAVLVGLCLFMIFAPGDFGDSGYPNVINPLGIEALKPFLGVGFLLMAFIPVAIILSAASVVQRFRRSQGRERAQLKWLTAAAATVALAFLISMTASTTIGTGSGSSFPVWIQMLQHLSLVSFILIPVAIAVALLKHQLYDIDVLINRTIVYGALTAVLAAAYFGIVVLLQRLLEPVTQQSDLAVAGSTLAVAALARPLRSRLQIFIDQRFYRRKYHAATILDAFSARLRDEVDLDSLRGELVEVVGRTMQPVHASLWLRRTD